MNEKEISNFWGAHPCGEEVIGGIKNDYEEFFNRYDAFRYTQEKHILRCLDAINFNGKRVLEIGLGLGADSEQIIRRGAIWSGVDLTPESIDRVTKRLSLRNLPHEHLQVGSVCELPFEENTFDIIFSHGVLHHVPHINKAQAELFRVLKPKGLLVVMLYARYSLNYLVSIYFLRRVALAMLYLLHIKAKGIIAQHLENARKIGLFQYLRMKNFIHCNTDGPLNPYSKVYDIKQVKEDFPKFKIMKIHKEFMHAPPLPVSWLPLAHLLGWHFWVYMVPVKNE
jgi:ubiquinone/menaquinone biosynthesis C-methylase UbiE